MAHQGAEADFGTDSELGTHRNDHFGTRYVQKGLPLGQPRCDSDTSSFSTLPGYVSLLIFCYAQTFRKGGTPVNRVQ
jgi:hypothetical protein